MAPTSETLVDQALAAIASAHDIASHLLRLHARGQDDEWPAAEDLTVEQRAALTLGAELHSKLAHARFLVGEIPREVHMEKRAVFEAARPPSKGTSKRASKRGAKTPQASGKVIDMFDALKRSLGPK